ncbi:MAG: ABC transporter permease [Deltaproteobacteria bacterium]|nr:ABC transporter permease [Deltaproteobacteria bacterium]
MDELRGKLKHAFFITLVFRQYWRTALNRVGLICVLLLFLTALLAPVLAGNKPLYLKKDGHHFFPLLFDTQEFIGADFKKLALAPGDKIIFPPVPFSPTEYNLDAPLVPPGTTHRLGTDEQGRDVLSRLIHGSRISLSVGFVAVGLYVFLGMIVGALAGYYGGKVDLIISRFIEVMICFPTFFLILAVLAFLGPSLLNIMIIIGLTGWTGIARLVRGEFLKLRNQDFVTGIRASGASAARIIFRHILPNAMAPVMVSASFGVASAILVESSLSFLGFGVQPPTPSWGDILSQSRDFMDIAWWLTLFPGIAIFVTITAFNLVGEGLRDAVDPKLRSGT